MRARLVRHVATPEGVYLHRDDLAAYLRAMAADARAADAAWATALDDVARGLERSVGLDLAAGGDA